MAYYQECHRKICLHFYTYKYIFCLPCTHMLPVTGGFLLLRLLKIASKHVMLRLFRMCLEFYMKENLDSLQWFHVCDMKEFSLK